VFSQDDIYANVDEFHVELDDTVAPPGGPHSYDQFEEATSVDSPMYEHRQPRNVDNISNHVTVMTSSNTDSGDEHGEKAEDNRETSSARVVGGKLLLKIKQLRSLVESVKNKSDVVGASKISSITPNSRHRSEECDRRPDEEALSTDNKDVADAAMNIGLRQGDVKAVIAQLIADRNAAVRGPSVRRPSLITVPAAGGDTDEKDSAERSETDDRGAVQTNLLTSQIVLLNQRRRSVPVGIVFGSRPLIATLDNDESSEDGKMREHGGQVDIKLTRKPPTMDKSK